MGETDTGAKDALQPSPEGGQPSDPGAGSTSQTTTFTQEQVTEQVTKQVSDALAEQGRKHKVALDGAVAEERESNLVAFKETQERIRTFEKELKEMSESGGDDMLIAKLIQTKQTELDGVKTERESLKQEKAAHEMEWQDKQGRIKRAEESNFEIDLRDLAEKYQGGDPNRLKEACRAVNITNVDGARKLADILWLKRTSGPEALINGVPASGGTGGEESGSESIIAAYMKTPNDPKVRDAYMALRRKREAERGI